MSAAESTQSPNMRAGEDLGRGDVMRCSSAFIGGPAGSNGKSTVEDPSPTAEDDNVDDRLGNDGPMWEGDSIDAPTLAAAQAREVAAAFEKTRCSHLEPSSPGHLPDEVLLVQSATTSHAATSACALATLRC